METAKEESIQCPYCDGEGYTPEHTDHDPSEPCIECPVPIPCDYCYGSGRVTTKLMKEHIAHNNIGSTDDDDNLPF